MRIARWTGLFTLVAFVVYTYGYVDFSVPLSVPHNLPRLLFEETVLSAALYVSFLCIFYGWYVVSIHTLRAIVATIIVVVSILFLSYPAFSNDIYNYIATAKVLYLYGENPYVTMPIEIIHEPMLSFMHAANKTALYGISWLVFSAIPFFLGGNQLFITLFLFKALVVACYFGSLRLLYLLSNKNMLPVALFGLNPLVLMETVVSGHNDIVMIFFALLAYYLVQKRLIILASTSLIISIGVKYATIVLVPLFMWTFIQHFRRKRIVWTDVWVYSALSLFVVVLISPLREEMYPWYFQWVLAFAVLTPNRKSMMAFWISVSFGLTMRFAPYALTRNWGNWVPLGKAIVTIVPPAIVVLYIGCINVLKKYYAR